MIVTCINHDKVKFQEITTKNQALLKETHWIDLLSPSKEDEELLERYLGFNIPTREEMREIELSSRLYKREGTLFMTVAMIAHSDSPDPKLDPVTFVLTSEQLITLRYIEPQSFRLFYAHLQGLDIAHRDAVCFLIELLDATIDRLADILEWIARHLDDYSKVIFQSGSARLDYRQLMQQIGENGDLTAKARESLLTFSRLIPFLLQNVGPRIDEEGQARLATQSKDVASLSDHASFLSNKVVFLLDATLGMVSIEQNNIIKIFSVAAVIFLPPTLIASIYGMNFHFMPELSWKWGYLVAIGLMLVSSWLPYKFFKYRKWL